MTAGRRVLACGGRDYADRATVYGTLDALEPGLLIHGAARGADSLAADWAKARGVPVQAFPADWARYGKQAGPLRNRQMLVEGKPDLVVAFPGGGGTAHMVRIADEAGVPVMRIVP